MRSLLIDCQILQTAAFDRGMGKYTLSLLRELIKGNVVSRQYDEIRIILNQNLEISHEQLAAIDKYLPGLEKVRLDIPTDIDIDIDKKYDDAVSVIDTYIKSAYRKNDTVTFMITSPFFVKFPAVFPSKNLATNVAIVYDLIPYKIWHLQHIFPDEIYMKHFKLFFEADHLFSISHAVKDDLVNIVGVSESKITPIDGAAFEREETSLSILNPVFVEPFILMPSGPIVHKNNERAVSAFDKFNKTQGNKYTLVITSHFDDVTRDKLLTLSKKVAFSGNISDDELAVAYEHAECMLFPSLAEGLGMPILEAARVKLPIACSTIPVLTELSSQGFYQFNPLDISSITEALKNACMKEQWQERLADYARINSKYTWYNSATVLLKNMPSKNLATHRPILPSINIEVVDPGKGTPAGRLGEVLFAYLSDTFDVKVRCIARSTPLVPSYLPYMQLPLNQKAITIKISDKKNLFGKKNKIVINDGLVRLEATTKVIDSALSIRSWNFTREGRKLKVKSIYDLIRTKLKEVPQ